MLQVPWKQPFVHSQGGKCRKVWRVAFLQLRKLLPINNWCQEEQGEEKEDEEIL